MELSLVVAGLLILTVVLINLSMNMRPVAPVILAIQLASVVVLAAYAIVDRSHRNVCIVVVLVGSVNLYRRVRPTHH